MDNISGTYTCVNLPSPFMNLIFIGAMIFFALFAYITLWEFWKVILLNTPKSFRKNNIKKLKGLYKETKKRNQK